VFNQFNFEVVVAKAVLHDHCHRIEERLDTVLGFGAPEPFLEHLGIKRG